MTTRPKPLHFREYNTGNFGGSKPDPSIDPELHNGTTPLAKMSGGKAARYITNFHHPVVCDADDLGGRAIIDGFFKLVAHEQKNSEARRALFDVQADPAEKSNLIEQQPATAEKLQTALRNAEERAAQPYQRELREVNHSRSKTR